MHGILNHYDSVTIFFVTAKLLQNITNYTRKIQLNDTSIVNYHDVIDSRTK